MKESITDRRARALDLTARLKLYYPDAKCALLFTNPLELLVATILSAQCTDERVNVVTRDLFAAFRTAAHYADADPEHLEERIRSINFYRNKAKALRGMGARLVEHHAGEVPVDLDHLISLPGVGRKTANVVMGNAFDVATGIVVDTHVARVSYRLGFTRAEDPVAIENDLRKLIPQVDWILFAHLLIFHGRQICKARTPQCERCPIEGDCPKRGVKSASK